MNNTELQKLITSLETLHAGIHQVHATCPYEFTHFVFKKSDVILQVLSKLREEKAQSENAIGCAIAQRISGALVGLGIDYQKIVDVVYKECLDIASEQKNGDWLEMPNGDTYTKTFTVTPKERA